jgi:hypothetical protein
MERVPRAKVQNREKAQTDATPETEIVHRKVKVAREPARDKAREQAKAPVAVRVEDEERGKAAGGRPKYFHRSILSSLQHGEAA